LETGTHDAAESGEKRKTATLTAAPNAIYSVGTGDGNADLRT